MALKLESGGKVLFIGQTRFSVYSPKSGAWKASNGSRFRSEPEYREYLFSDERLAGRSAIFFNLSLPQLAAASKGHGVRHLISYSEYLPEKYQDRLREAAAAHNFLILDKQVAGQAPKTVESVARASMFSETTADPYQPFGVYRLDDDDLLPINYFDLNARYVKSEFVGMQVSLGTGITAIYMEGKFYNARRSYHPMLGIGYMSIQNFSGDGTLNSPPAVMHNTADRHYPVVMDSKRLGYVWTRHIEQDTSLGLVASPEGDITDSIRNHINQHPAVTDLNELHESFPVLEGLITASADANSEHQELVTSPQIIPSPGLQFAIDNARGALTITTKIVCDMQSEVRNALLSFELVDGQGNAVDREVIQDHMKEQQVSCSGNPGIGWFRYLTTRPGQNQTVMKFALPSGVYLSRVTVRKWRKPDTAITLRSITVEHSDR
ncbi:glycosyltransferase [Paeniglutamicibacter psychrophenolicus]|uniref:glycosyltransferase n=1 Tax=Paeniglutamicibacter psychrophenolicus TaxID=257454 RepID=UPI002782E0C0|nr:glycosyltransferase [Paeniglutamicibacter psychrophenolicus]MDQ0095935.1 hypothetical protein [Paeniglutamicibacter psychrophenolicus]